MKPLIRILTKTEEIPSKLSSLPISQKRFARKSGSFLFLRDDKSEKIVKEEKTSLFSKLYTTIELQKASLDKTRDSGSLKNIRNLLNLLSVNNSNENKK